MRVRFPALSHPRTGILPQMPARGHPRGRLGETSTPTRSARTPLVMRSGRRREETPTAPGVAPVRELRLRRSHHTSPTPAKGRSPRARTRRAARAHACAWARLARRLSRPRAASPALPRRRTRSAAPEVPSIDETGHRQPGRKPFRAPVWSTGGRDEPYLYPGMVLSTACCQPGDNIRRFFFKLAVSAALDGVAGRRPGSMPCT
jgi:hypothetical protein